MRHLDLFSGIGGFALAARWAGIETVGFCEIEDYPRKVLEKNFPGVPVHNDIRELSGDEFGAIDIITGGYPCQPFSTAGKRKGDKDDRHLWPEMLRVITQARPTWIIAENVVGHITMGLDRVLSDLESEGYAARPVIIPACGVGAKHKRDRVWILANSSCGRLGKQNKREIQQQGRAKAIRSSETIPGTKSLGRNEKQAPDSSAGGSRLQGALRGCDSGARNDTWLPEPSVARVVDGIPRRVDRVKSLGNAIVPEVAYKIMRAIKIASDGA